MYDVLLSMTLPTICITTVPERRISTEFPIIGAIRWTLDGDYFYFNHLEDRPFMDLLTGGDSHTKRKQMLCRIRLPD